MKPIDSYSGTGTIIGYRYRLILSFVFLVQVSFFSSLYAQRLLYGAGYQDLSELNQRFEYDMSQGDEFFLTSRDMAWRPDGKRFFILEGSSTNNIAVWNVSRAFDLSTAQYVGTQTDLKSDVINFESGAVAMHFSDDGRKLFIMWSSTETIAELSLSEPYDLFSTISRENTLSVTAYLDDPVDMAFSPDGNKLFIYGDRSKRLSQLSLNGPFDITGDVQRAHSFGLSAEEGTISGFFFNYTGNRLFFHSSTRAAVFNYSLNIPFDLAEEPSNRTERFFTGLPGGVRGIQRDDWGSRLFFLNNSSIKGRVVTSFGRDPFWFIEDQDRPGIMRGTDQISVIGQKFSNPGTELVYGTDYFINNLVPGLAPRAFVEEGGQVLTLTFADTATDHRQLRSGNLNFTFTNTAFQGRNAFQVAGSTNHQSRMYMGFFANPITAFAGDGQVQLNWLSTSVAEDYKVYDINAAGQQSLLGTVEAPNTQFTDTTIANGEFRRYRVNVVYQEGATTVENIAGTIEGAVAQNGFGNSMEFAGGANVTIDHRHSLSDPQGTVEFWLKIKESPEGKNNGFYMIANKMDPNGNNGWSLYHDKDQLVAQIKDFGSQIFNLSSERNLIDNVWHHVALSYDFTRFGGFGVLYIDGERAARSTGLPQFRIGAGPVLIGKGPGTFWTNLEGEIDEFRIWKRVLADGEVLDKMNSRSDGRDQDLAFVLNMDEPAGTTVAYDGSRSGFNGAVIAGIQKLREQPSFGATLSAHGSGKEVRLFSKAGGVVENEKSIEIYRVERGDSEQLIYRDTLLNIRRQGIIDQQIRPGHHYQYRTYAILDDDSRVLLNEDKVMATSQFNNVAVFEGEGDHIESPSGPFATSLEGTVEFWIKMEESPAGKKNGFYMIANRLNQEFNEGWLFYHNEEEFFARFRNTGGETFTLGAGRSLIDSTWHHVALTYNLQSSVRSAVLFVDGEEVAVMDRIDMASITSSSILLGKGAGDFWTDFEGKMDEFRIWSYQRTVDKIRADMNTPLDGTDRNLEVLLSMDELNASPIAYDASTNNINAASSGVQYMRREEPQFYVHARPGAVQFNYTIENGDQVQRLHVYRSVGRSSETLLASIDSFERNQLNVDTDQGLQNSLLYSYRMTAVLADSSEVPIGTDAAVPAGDLGTFAAFAGDNDYLEVADDPMLRDSTGTIEFRIRMTKGPAADGNGFIMIANKLADSQSDGWSFYHDRTRLVAQMKSGGRNFNIFTDVNLLDSSWHHIAMSYDFTGVDTTRLYIDGQEAGLLADIDLDISADNPILLGGAEASFWDDFTGEIDEFRIWEYQRSAGQVNDFQDQALNGAEPGLVMLLHLDEPKGYLRAYDDSPNNFNGMLKNDVSFTGKSGPGFQSGSQFSVNEQHTGIVLDVNAFDGLSVDEGITYSIEGMDAALFTIDSDSGSVSFINVPDFENPQDADENNEYELTVTATSINGSSDQAIIVTVTNVNEVPEVISPFADAELDLGFANFSIDLLQVFRDPDGDLLVYEVASNNTMVADFELIEDSLHILSGSETGVTTITVSAADPSGSRATDFLTINVLDTSKLEQTITFGNVEDKTFGDAPFELSASSSSGLPVSFSSSNPSVAGVVGNTVTISGAGTTIITASQAGDGNYNAASDVLQTLTVNKAGQVITFTTLPDMTFGDMPFNLMATGGASENPVTFTSSDPHVATVTGSLLTIVGAGTVTITASQSGNANYHAATNEEQTLTVNKAGQVITFPAIENIDIASTTRVTLAATADTGLPISYNLEQGDGNLSGNTLTVNSTGTFTIIASQEGNENYNAASLSRSFQVTDSRKEDQSINFMALEDKTYGDAPVNLTATASSGLAVSYSVSGPASLSGSELTLTGAGPVTITADQPGNEQFNPASSVEQSFTVQKAALTVSADDQAITYGEAIPELTFTYSGFVNGEDASVLAEEPQANTTAGPDTDAGTYPITLSGGSDDNYAFSLTEGTLTIEQANQTIDFEQIADVDIAGQTSVSLSASASSGLEVTYTLIEGDGTIEGNTLSLNSTGIFVVEASQSGNNNYLSAESVTQSFVVTDTRKDNQIIDFAAIADVTYGEVVDLSATASSGLDVSYTIVDGPADINGTQVTFSEIGTVTIEAKQSGNASFLAADPVQRSFEVLPATLEVVADDQTTVFNGEIPTLTYSFSGFVNGEDESVLTTTPTASTNATTGDDAGTYVITVSGGGAANYAFTYTDGTLTIEKAQATVTLSDLEQEVDGTAKLPTVTTEPADLNFTITFDGSADAPVEAGEYQVEVMIDETNYQGFVTGTFVLTGSEDVLSISGEVSIKVYPNPVIDNVSISGVEMKEIYLLDLEGRVIRREAARSIIRWDLSDLSEGIYLIRIETMDDETITKRILKN